MNLNLLLFVYCIFLTCIVVRQWLRIKKLRVLVEEDPRAYINRVDVAIENLQRGRNENISRIITLLGEAHRLGICAEKVAYRISDLQLFCNDRETRQLENLIEQIKPNERDLPVTLRSPLQKPTHSG